MFSRMAFSSLAIASVATLTACAPDAPFVWSVYIEAEDFADAVGYTIEDDPAASGGKFVRGPTPGGGFGLEPEDTDLRFIGYGFALEEAGFYRFWVRVSQTGSEDNGAHVEIDNENVGPIQACQDTGWRFTASRRTEADHCGRYNFIDVVLGVGDHALVIRPRDPDFKFDSWGLEKLE